MQICELKYARSDAVENMAIDAAMLAASGISGQILLRIYGWTEPAITFGYSQAWSWVRNEPGSTGLRCIRRITGGGIVDHRNDLTYALTIPPTHPAYRDPALNIYKSLHQHIADILLDLGIAADLAACSSGCNNKGEAAGICFQQPEPYDVIAGNSGAKLAGAAMKRNQSGILVQGSLDQQHLSGINALAFGTRFARRLADWLSAEAVSFQGTLDHDILEENRTRFGSREWNERR